MREIFHRFLLGATNYDGLARILGTSRGTARNILANPIYTGWMVYDEKRDPSPGAKRLRLGGRQGDRRKIARAPDEIIRRKVIDEGLVSEADFERVQYLIRQKADYHIRLRREVGQFIYNGFLWCAKCGDRLHTYRNNFDRFYYICSNKKRKNKAGEPLCLYTGFINRDRLEPVLDQLFGEQLTDRRFLERLYKTQCERAEQQVSRTRQLRLQEDVGRLEAKRHRLTDLFIDGEISREERHHRQEQIDRELEHTRALLAAVAIPPIMDTSRLAELFAPFLEWRFLAREEKRRLLVALSPKVQVEDYLVVGMHCTIDSHPPGAGA